jgi:hypothetical protein
MKRTNVYFATVVKRTNIIKVAFLSIFLLIGSWPSAIIEVFTRRNFGERHFLLPLNLFLAAMLGIIPFGMATYFESWWDTIINNLTWYGFITAFVVFSLKRYSEIIRDPGTFDLQRYTLSSGEVNSWFHELNLFGGAPSIRTISIYLEPAVFLIAGIILTAAKQHIGVVLIVCSVIYSLNWSARYYLGDQFIMDKIDETICNEELVNVFVDGKLPGEARGFDMHTRRPNDREFRRKVAESMIEDEPAVDVL